ncbi:helix-turn-helix transcriptional regulator [Bosea sp. 2RAB26]
MLDRLGCGYLAIEDHRHIIEANPTARLILGGETGSVQSLTELMGALKRLIARAPNRPALGSMSWIVIGNKDDAPFILNQAQPADVVTPGISVVMLVDLDAHLQPNRYMLQRMFGLTLAETRIALQLARGDQPADVARSCNVSRTTIRSQLASVFAKTSTRRQAELVKLLALLALLP